MNLTWSVTPLEHQQNESQFLQLQPIQGLIGGDQARPFFLRSGLPPATLAQVGFIIVAGGWGEVDKGQFLKF